MPLNQLIVTSCAALLIATSSKTAAADAPFVLTTFTHMEGQYQYPNIVAFDSHANKLRFAMTLFEEYGARMTIESEKTFANACVTFADNVMAEAVAREHGVGTHCDFGGFEAAVPPATYALKFLLNKSKVDALVGASNNRHCSGGLGASDWILGAQIAGFEFRSEAVAFGYLSMPMSERPRGWTDEYIRTTVYHVSCPLDLATRLHPIRMQDALDWNDDKGAPYVLIGGGIGRIDGFSEEAAGLPIGTNPTFNQVDVNAFFAELDLALAVRDPTRFAKTVVHFPVASLDAADETVLRQILLRIRNDYVLTGKLIWATQGDAYDAFLMWDSGMPSDLNHDGVVGGADLALLLNRWGAGAGIGDINFDGVVDGADIASLLSAW